jgi:hypothetical protein
MPSWSDHDDHREEYWTAVAADTPNPWDPDAIEVPEPYTTDEWGNTEGARQQAQANLPTFSIVGRVVHPGGIEGHTVSATVSAATLEGAIEIANARRPRQRVVWIAL